MITSLLKKQQLQQLQQLQPRYYRYFSTGYKEMFNNKTTAVKYAPPHIKVTLPSFNGISYQDAIDKRHRFLSPSLSTFQAFEKPFYPTRAYMQYLWDHNDKQHLDLLAQNLTISVGHNHPYVLNATKEQLNKMVHCTTMYYNECPALCAEELLKTFPKSEDWVVHFVNSGSEAVDLALLLARVYTNSWDILAIRNSYHGLHSTAMAVTGLYKCKQHIPHSFGVHHVVQPDMYRGLFCDDENAAIKYAQDVEDTITYSTSGKIAGFIFEKVQGYGGIHVLPEGYLTKACQSVKDAGGLVIADEVQTGFGRMGTHYWSFEMDNIIPDIVVTAKGLGNGLPIAAVIVKREIAEAMTHKQFFNTYGGNPTVTATGKAVLETILCENIQENSLVVGNAFKEVLIKLQKKYSHLIGDVRGQGLMYGVEIVNCDSKTPNSKLAVKMFEMLRDEGVIMGLGGLHKNILRVMPPMCVTLEDAKFLEDVFDYVLSTYSATV